MLNNYLTLIFVKEDTEVDDSINDLTIDFTKSKELV